MKRTGALDDPRVAGRGRVAEFGDLAARRVKAQRAVEALAASAELTVGAAKRAWLSTL
jgi:hypothetical protein